MPANVQTLGRIQAPSDGLASEGEDVFNTYGVVQSIGSNGGVTAPPKFYVKRLVDADLDNTMEWVEVTNQDDINFLDTKAKAQGLIVARADEQFDPIVDNQGATDAFRTGGSTNHPLVTQAPVTVIPNAPNPNGSIGTNVIRPQKAVVLGDTSSLRYPMAYGITSDSDYVSFRFYDYLPPFKPSGGNRGTQGSTANSNLGIKYTAYSQSIDPVNMQEANGTYYPPIIMYMPEDLGGQYGADWTGKSFTNLAVEALRTVGSSGAIDNGSYGRTVDTATGALKALGYRAAVDAINKGLGTNVQATDALSGITGTILNPNTEMMYQSSTMRGFSLRFKMQARSEDENIQIRKICTTFKRAMLPTYGGEVIGKGIGPGTPTDKKPGNGNFITLPKIVQVSFMTGSELNEYITQYKPCAITAVDINHTPDGAWAAYKGGAPVATELKITFKELKLIFSQEISEGASF